MIFIFQEDRDERQRYLISQANDVREVSPFFIAFNLGKSSSVQHCSHIMPTMGCTNRRFLMIGTECEIFVIHYIYPTSQITMKTSSFTTRGFSIKAR